MNEKYQTSIGKIKSTLAPFKAHIKRPAQGYIPYDYLVPSGFYQEQWDWDAFFMGVGLASELSSEAIYLRNWALNYILNAKKGGYSSACVTPKGPEKGHRTMLMKPFLAQGSYFAAKFLGDFSWIKSHWNKLKQVVLYREKHRFNKEYDLSVWRNSIESGIDDNLAVLNYPKNSVIATDVNTYVYREYKAMSLLSKEVGKSAEAAYFNNRANTVRKNIQRHLWNDSDGIFYNLNATTGEHIKNITLSDFLPLWEKLIPREKGQASIKRYILSPEHLWSKYGVRTLSKSDPGYNNKKKITPYSNWQGPVWPIANYIYMHVLLNYGFQQQAIILAKKISNLVITDIKTSGGMHENYDAETGKPLAAPNFVSWNILVVNMLYEAVNKINPFRL